MSLSRNFVADAGAPNMTWKGPWVTTGTLDPDMLPEWRSSEGSC